MNFKALFVVNIYKNIFYFLKKSIKMQLGITQDKERIFYPIN